MPSLLPQGATIANLRRAMGYTQVELALRVGVSERTVRNAERGVSIKHDFLKFIANGLGVSVADVVAPASASVGNASARWERNAELLLGAVRRVIAEDDPSTLLALADQSVAVRHEGSVPSPELGHHLFREYRGVSGLSRFLVARRQFWRACGDVDYYVEAPTGGGDVVILRCGHEVPLRGGTRCWARSVVVCEFAQERLVRIDDFFGAGSGPPEAGVLARYSKPAEGWTSGALAR